MASGYELKAMRAERKRNEVEITRLRAEVERLRAECTAFLLKYQETEDDRVAAYFARRAAERERDEARALADRLAAGFLRRVQEACREGPCTGNPLIDPGAHLEACHTDACNKFRAALAEHAAARKSTS